MVTNLTSTAPCSVNSGESKQKNNIFKDILVYTGINTVGGITGGLFSFASSKAITPLVFKDAKKLSNIITPEVIDKTMDLADIEKLGIRINNIDKSDFYSKLFTSENLLTKYIHKKIRKDSLEIPLGHNAIYHDNLRTINISKRRGGAYIFHELGHAKNYQSTSKFMKTITKMRQPIVTATIASIGALCAFIPRAEGEEAKTFKGKVQNFLKDNCVAITAVGALATPIEEGIASIRGAKIAKKVLSKDIVKQINKMNAKAFLSYAAIAAGTMLTTHLISKFSDKYREGKSEKEQSVNVKIESKNINIAA